MNHITHEVIVRDRGTAVETTSLRSRVADPRRVATLAYVYHETKLSPDTSKELIQIIHCHHDALSREAGALWVGEQP